MKSSIFACVFLFAFASFAVADHHEEGFISLFDGKSLTNWDGNPKFWSVEDGAITGTTTKDNPTKGNTFVIWRGGMVDDFELRLKFKIVGGNSGIQYRSEDKGNWVVGGYQGDFESGDTYSGILYEEKGRGILAQRGQVTHVLPGDKPKIEVVATIGDTNDINKVIRKEDWNEYKIIARGNQLMHIINGRMTCQVIDHDEKKGAKSGVLALQLHAGPPMKVQFKDIRLKPLSGVNIAGKWDFKIEFDGGAGEPNFTFDVDGEDLKIDYTGMVEDVDDIVGKIKGEKVSWVMNGFYNDTEVSAKYEGKVVDFGRMNGTVTINDQLDGEWTATRAK